jgi:hypothetical protein
MGVPNTIIADPDNALAIDVCGRRNGCRVPQVSPEQRPDWQRKNLSLILLVHSEPASPLSSDLRQILSRERDVVAILREDVLAARLACSRFIIMASSRGFRPEKGRGEHIRNRLGPTGIATILSIRSSFKLPCAVNTRSPKTRSNGEPLTSNTFHCIRTIRSISLGFVLASII